MNTPPAQSLQPVSLLSTAYLPPLQWFSKWAAGLSVLEQCENYTKGSYRNRCHIIGANGVLALSIPLAKGKNTQTPIREARIAYHQQDWRKAHWQSIQSAYGKAPFFEYYADDIRPLFDTQPGFLWDWNDALLECLADCIGLEKELPRTKAYEAAPQSFDYRNAISPKENKQQTDPFFDAPTYPQLFTERYGSIDHLSVLDLLFCTGPESISILEGAYRTPDNADYTEMIYKELDGHISPLEKKALERWEATNPDNEAIAENLRLEWGMRGNYNPRIDH